MKLAPSLMRSGSSLPAWPLPASDLQRAFDLLPERDWRRLANRRVFMTGGTGFVGKWLLATLLHANARLGLACRVTVLSRNPREFAATFPHLALASGVDLIEGDVRTFTQPNGTYDTVLHAATDVVAKSAPEATFDTCVDGTRRVLEFADRIGASNLLLVSSGAVYGRQPPELTGVPETYNGAPDPLLPTSAYGEGKRAAEWLAGALAARSSVQVKIARCFAFVGPYLPVDKQFAIGNFMGSALRQEDVVIEGDGTPYRSYLYAADMAAWLWAVLFRGRSGTAYNVGAEESLSIIQLARRVNELAGAHTGIQILRPPLAGSPAERYVPDTRRARAELGLPEALPLDDAIVRTLAWHRHHAALEDASS